MLIAKFQVCCLTHQLLKRTRLFLIKLPFQKTSSPSWKTGVPTPINEGTLTPNQEAFQFASGHVRMEGNVIKHLSVVKGNQTIGAMLKICLGTPQA